MKVLVACEFSGIVRDAFIAEGHDAISCDLLPTERPGPHVQGDVRPLLRAMGKGGKSACLPDMWSGLERTKVRSRFHPGMAAAMAKQWGSLPPL